MFHFFPPPYVGRPLFMMKIGPKRHDLSDLKLTLDAVIKKRLNIFFYCNPRDTEEVWVKYQDPETSELKTLWIGVGGETSTKFTSTASFAYLEARAGMKQLQLLEKQPYTPSEWLSDYDLYLCPESKGNQRETSRRYFLVSKRNSSLTKKFVFSMTSPLTELALVNELRNSFESAVKSPALTHSEALKILTKVASVHNNTVNLLRAGDVIFTSNSWLNKVDSSLAKEMKEFPVSHAAIMGSHGTILESTASGKSINRKVAAVTVLDNSKHGWTAYRCLHHIAFYSNADLSVNTMDQGKEYGGIVKAAINTIFKISVFSGVSNPNRMICTQFANKTLRKLATTTKLSTIELEKTIKEDSPSFLTEEFDMESANRMMRRLSDNGALKLVDSNSVQQAFSTYQEK